MFNFLLDSKMQNFRSAGLILWYVMVLVICSQFFLLMYKRVGFLPLWILIEYMQLISFIPAYNFRLIPYLYDMFKPFLISHLILFDDYVIYDEMSTDFFNINYEHYELAVSKLLQSFVNISILFAIVIILHISFLVFSLRNQDYSNENPQTRAEKIKVFVLRTVR